MTGGRVSEGREAATGFPLIRPVGLTGLLITFSDRLSDEANRAALNFRDRIEAAGIVGVLESATSLTSTFLLFDPVQVAPDALRLRVQALLAQQDGAGVAHRGRVWRLPTAFGGETGPQLAEAAALAGVGVQRAVEELCAAPLRVLTIGFAPGQPYLGTLPPQWDLPRQAALTPQVPPGAIVVAIRQLVLFANASPTGWRWVGQTGFRVFRPEAEKPFALRPGDLVQLVPVSEQEVRAAAGNGGATCEAAP